MTPRPLVALPLLLLLAAPVAALGEAPHPTAVTTIQPGDLIRSLGVGCTAGFVFDGVGALAGRVYVSSAAHCFSSGGQIVSSDAQRNFGVVVLLGSRYEVSLDYALVEVKPEFHGLVQGAVRGHPALPRGVAGAGDTARLDEVQISGHGAGFEVAEETREGRTAFLVAHDATTHRLVGPMISGDSGGPLVHIPSGGALGLVSRIRVPCECTEIGPTVEHVLAHSASRGFTVALRDA